ncbi:MAG: hypothetical protein HY062_09580, partial [Bacteroidetes bacterium]|nr:hypothetical protein [Bacteroidota bacterium]
MKNIKPLIILLLSLRFAANVNAQTSTTYSILSTAYDRSTGGYFPLGSVDNYWFLTKTQNMSVPLDPSTILTYPDNPTYIVQNSGNNAFSGIIANHSINTNTTTISNGQKV